MKPELFEFFTSELKRRSGIKLSSEKLYLIESRLDSISKENGFGDVSSYVESLKTNFNNDSHWRKVVEAMTTNETYFFRDKTPFDNLKNTILPHLIETGKPNGNIRIWCAACSTGQEPYSVAITLKEMEHQLGGRQFEIIGTDINDTVLEKARQGLYSQFEVQRGLPIQQVVKYFTKKQEFWQLNPEIRNRVRYRNLNLLDNFTMLGQFDIIFCRNVLIYFDIETKRSIFEKISKAMKPDGYLLLGASETTIGISDLYQNYSDRRGLFTKKLPNEENNVASSNITGMRRSHNNQTMQTTAKQLSNTSFSRPALNSNPSSSSTFSSFRKD